MRDTEGVMVSSNESARSLEQINPSIPCRLSQEGVTHHAPTGIRDPFHPKKKLDTTDIT